MAAKDLFAILDVVNDEFGFSAEALFVTERGSEMIIREADPTTAKQQHWGISFEIYSLFNWLWKSFN